MISSRNGAWTNGFPHTNNEIGHQPHTTYKNELKNRP
jgi:hypothetical protein